MLAARALRLSLDPDGQVISESDLPGARDAIVYALSVLESREEAYAGEAGRARSWKAQLNNLAPVHVHAPNSHAATLTTVPVSGMTASRGNAPAPVIHNDRAITLFLARGDSYLVRIHTSPGIANTFVSLDYGLTPKISASATPLPLRSPIDSMPGHLNSTRLLQIALDRELHPIEAYIVATTMPKLWAQLGGRAVPAISTPNQSDIDIAVAFCRQLSHHQERIATLRAQTSGWARAFDDWARECRVSTEPTDIQIDQHVVEGFSIPILEKNDKHPRQAVGVSGDQLDRTATSQSSAPEERLNTDATSQAPHETNAPEEPTRPRPADAQDENEPPKRAPRMRM